MLKVLRITTISLSLQKLLAGQLNFLEKIGMEVYTASSGDLHNNNHTKLKHLNRSITPFRDLRAVLELTHLIKKLKPIIVHTHTPKAGLVGLIAAWLCRVPVRMHTVAGLPLMEKKGFVHYLFIQMERLTYYFATGVYPNSKGLKDYIHSNISKSKKIKVIGSGTTNGINLSEFNERQVSDEEVANLKIELGLENQLIYIFIGRLVRDKGIEELVDSFCEVQEKQKNVKLLLVGAEEPELDPLPLHTLYAIKQNKDILSVGFQNDVRPYIVVSDILVFPSYREGFPNVPLQCGAFKKALILSDINGCNELVEHDKTGFLVPSKNKHKLAIAMMRLASDKEKRYKFGKAVYTNIKANYQQDKVLESLRAEYKVQLQKAGIDV